MSNLILGISAFYHDSAAVLIENGTILAAIHEERLSRIKHDKSFPVKAIEFCLESNGYTLENVSAVIFYEKPLLKFERLLETYYVFAPRGLKSFLSAVPVWIKEKLFLKSFIKKELARLYSLKPENINLLFSEHHLSHAASAFYPSPFDEAAILTIDGVGEWATGTICHGKGKDISLLKELHFPHSVGLLYSAVTYYLGFKVNSGEYKLMGLSPYGNPESENFKQIKDSFLKEVVDLKDDGSIFLNQDYFDYSTGLKMTDNKKWETLFGFKKRESETDIEQIHCDMALAIQQIIEEIVLRMAKTAQEITGAKNICLAGGVALNCCASGKLLTSGLFENIWVQPAAGDAGGALGAALAAHHIYYGAKRIPATPDLMQGSYLGPAYSQVDIKKTARKFKAPFQEIKEFSELCTQTASLIADGNVVGWFQGRCEWGPRALGNRSILADPANKEMQKRLNLKIKFRESFRPFAPSVLFENVTDFFDCPVPSPYMLLIAGINENRRFTLPENYHHHSVKEKLYFMRSDLPAITHLDYSARHQTVHKETNPKYWELISAIKKITGKGIVVNTSFNVRGEPIVCSPDDAYRCFMRTDMDILVMENLLFKKSEQPAWQEKKSWQEEFVLD